MVISFLDMNNKLIIMLLLTLLPMLSMGQREVSYLDSANLCLQREDVKGMEKWLQKGAKAGNKECMNELGDYYSACEEYKKAAKWYAQAADARGDLALAVLYLDGSLDKKGQADSLRGLPLLRRSERTGYRDAVYLTGRLFDAGAFYPQNYDSAVYMLRRLPDDGQALFMLAQYYEAGAGVEQDSLTAMDYFRRAGEAGYSDGYSYLGDFYKDGLAGIKPDSLQAFQTYMLAAGIPDGNANGLSDVAFCYLRGIGTRVDTAKAVYYLRDAVEAGSARAAAELADMYNYGRGGIEASGDTALMLYQLASQQDDPRGDYMIGAYLYNQGSYENAIGYLQSAMQHGSVDAAVLYAQALLTGSGVKEDPATAVGILEQMAPLDGSGHAHLWLGIAHYTGNGTTSDPELALRLLDTAASRGSVRAMMLLGQLYNGSEGEERDTTKVLYWYERAVAAGSDDAMVQLAGSYLDGESVPQNVQRAVELYQRAADLGNTEAMCRLGICYENGTGVTANARRAYGLYQQAAEAGSSFGMRLLAYCYGQGIYVDTDMEQAAEWFRRAAEAGDVHSAYVLGQLYASGEGVKKNKKEARRWLKLAADAGVAEAETLLQTL